MNGIPIHEVVLRVQRLAVRPTPDAPLQWYGGTVRFLLLDDATDWSTAFQECETMCEAAVAEYGLEYFKCHATIVSAPDEEALTEEALASVNAAWMQREGADE